MRGRGMVQGRERDSMGERKRRERSDARDADNIDY